jgi:hypothetical protein
LWKIWATGKIIPRASIAGPAWEPSGAKKAGIMVFAGNVDSSYTNTIFSAVK